VQGYCKHQRIARAIRVRYFNDVTTRKNPNKCASSARKILINAARIILVWNYKSQCSAVNRINVSNNDFSRSCILRLCEAYCILRSSKSGAMNRNRGVYRAGAGKERGDMDRSAIHSCIPPRATTHYEGGSENKTYQDWGKPLIVFHKLMLFLAGRR
jgi:hypothetical protein